MKLKQIALAVASMAAAPAFALTPSEVGGATQLWLTGSSSVYNSVFQGMMTLCQGMSYKDAGGVIRTNPGVNDVHVYYEFDPADPNKRPPSLSAVEPGFGVGDRVAYACTVQTFDWRAGVLEYKKVVMYHTVEGGSFNAYTPALALAGDTNPNIPTTLQRITEVADLGAVGQCAAGAATNTIIDVSGIEQTIPYYSKCRKTRVTLATPAKPAVVDVAGDTAPTTSVGGFSDTEYLINKLNLEIATDLGAIGSEVNTNIGQSFGVAVSYPLYAQLQKNDGIIATTAADGEACDGVYTAGACQPNLPAQVYSTVANQAAVGSINASLFGGLATGKVNLARLRPTSGTQSASNLRFLNKPCASGEASGAQNPARAVDSTATLIITENSSNESVKFTLNTATGKGEFALGLMSMENTPWPTFTADRWAFVKLNNVSPNSDSFQRAEAIKGNYPLWYELVAFTVGSPWSSAAIDLIAGINSSMGTSTFTNLKGLFITPLAGAPPGGNVSKGTRFENSCTPASQ